MSNDEILTRSETLTSGRHDGLTGQFDVPGDKSLSHRSLILGGLAIGTTRVTGLLEGDDVMATGRAMQALGAGIIRDSDGSWTITGVGTAGLVSPEAPLDLGNSGTGVRLLMGVVAGLPVTATFCGDESLSRRPMARVTDPLELNNLAGDEKHAETMNELRSKLAVWMKQCGDEGQATELKAIEQMTRGRKKKKSKK